MYAAKGSQATGTQCLKNMPVTSQTSNSIAAPPSFVSCMNFLALPKKCQSGSHVNSLEAGLCGGHLDVSCLQWHAGGHLLAAGCYDGESFAYLLGTLFL